MNDEFPPPPEDIEEPTDEMLFEQFLESPENEWSKTDDDND